MRTLFSTIFLLFLLTTVGCERHSREFAGKKSVPGAPKYTVTAKVSAVPAASHIEEVAPSGAGPDGADLYARSCAACHQVTGAGIPAVFPPLDASPYVTGDNVERLASIMLYGLAGPIDVNGTTYNSAMAAFGSQLNDAQLAAIATYIRTSWSNKASDVSSSVFADARVKWEQRGPFAISELGEEE